MDVRQAGCAVVCVVDTFADVKTDEFNRRMPYGHRGCIVTAPGPGPAVTPLVLSPPIGLIEGIVWQGRQRGVPLRHCFRFRPFDPLGYHRKGTNMTRP